MVGEAGGHKPVVAVLLSSETQERARAASQHRDVRISRGRRARARRRRAAGRMAAAPGGGRAGAARRGSARPRARVVAAALADAEDVWLDAAAEPATCWRRTASRSRPRSSPRRPTEAAQAAAAARRAGRGEVGRARRAQDRDRRRRARRARARRCTSRRRPHRRQRDRPADARGRRAHRRRRARSASSGRSSRSGSAACSPSWSRPCALGIAPLTDVDADDLVASGPVGRLVAGFRGRPPLDAAAHRRPAPPPLGTRARRSRDRRARPQSRARDGVRVRCRRPPHPRLPRALSPPRIKTW